MIFLVWDSRLCPAKQTFRASDIDGLIFHRIRFGWFDWPQSSIGA